MVDLNFESARGFDWFGVETLGYRVWGLGFRDKGLEFWVIYGFGVSTSVVRAQRSLSRVKGLELKFQDAGFGVEGSGPQPQRVTGCKPETGAAAGQVAGPLVPLLMIEVPLFSACFLLGPPYGPRHSATVGS